MKIEICPETEKLLRTIAARYGMPAGEAEKFEVEGPEGDNRYTITLYPDQMMAAVRRAYQLGVEHSY